MESDYVLVQFQTQISPEKQLKVEYIEIIKSEILLFEVKFHYT